MKGKYSLIRGKKVEYDFDFCRNITILNGDSCTGKTTFVDLLATTLAELSRNNRSTAELVHDFKGGVYVSGSTKRSILYGV